MSTLSPRRVTVVTYELRGLAPVGGMGTATTFLALALARMGHSVEILIGWRSSRPMDPYWQQVYDDAGIRVRRAPQSAEQIDAWHFEATHEVALALREDPPDVVVAHDLAAPAYSALRLRQAGVAFENTLFVVFCHGTRRYVMDLARTPGVRDLRDVLAVGVVERLAVELADMVVSPSAYLLGWMREQSWRLPELAVVIPHFTRASAAGESVTVGLESDRLERLVFFGRLDEKKGIRQFAAALNALEPQLLHQVDLELLGKETATWTRDRVEALLSERTKAAFRKVEFATNLDQHHALAHLQRPGTLAVMPSLQENSPSTVYECLELGVPFLASSVGGIPELVAAEDRERTLFEPTPAGVEAALRRVLGGERGIRPVRPAFRASDSSALWDEVVRREPSPQPEPGEPAVDVVVVHRGSREVLARCTSALRNQSYSNFVVTVESSREAGLRAGTAPLILFLDAEDVPDDELLRVLVYAQRFSDADVVTCGIRLRSGQTHFFSGRPGGLAVLDNDYGTVALIRRSLLDDVSSPWPAEADPDWPLLARLALSGAQIDSIPLALVTRVTGPGSVDGTPGDALLALRHLDGSLPDPVRSLARVAAGVAAHGNSAQSSESNSFRRRAMRRLRQLRA